MQNEERGSGRSDVRDSPPADLSTCPPSDLLCPTCGYILTGLPEHRCPECGSPFDPDELRRIQARLATRQIAFERAHGWRKVPAWFVTWATVLFVPWRFARQIVTHVHPPSAALFGLICFTTTVFCMFFEAEWEVWVSWILTAIIYLVFQTILLTALDFSGWREWRRSLLLWSAVGGYTSAVMCTEFHSGPPLVQFQGAWFAITAPIWALLWEFGHVSLFGADDWTKDFLSFQSSMIPYSFQGWLQLTLWLTGLTWIFCGRISRRRTSIRTRIIMGVFVFNALLLLYAFTVEQIGMSIIYDMISDW